MMTDNLRKANLRKKAVETAGLRAADNNEEVLPMFSNGKWLWEQHYPEGISWKTPIFKKPLYHIIDQAALKYPNNVMIEFEGRSWSYADMGHMVDRVAEGLQKFGVSKGTKVGLFLPNSPYSFMFFFGVLKAGGTVVNYNPLYVERELAGQIEDSETDIMVTLDSTPLLEKMDAMLKNTRLRKVIVCPFAETLPFARKMADRFLRKDAAKVKFDSRHISFIDIVDNHGQPISVLVDAESDVAVLQYTGGTTGVPKAAMLTHANLYANMMQVSTWMKDLRHGQDSIIGVLPLFHVFAMTVVMNCSIYAGLKILLHAKFDVKDVLEDIRKHRPSIFPAVPAVFNAIANAPETAKYDFSCLRFCITGGAPMAADVQRLFEEKTGSRALAEAYGLTEAAPACTFNPMHGLRKAGSVGQPLPGTIVEIISREDGTTVLPADTRGEVCISGPQVMKGYYKRPDATADVIKNGRLHTGDVGYFDAQGYLHLVDRIKDLILVRGYNVYPRVVEEAIYLHPSVEECIVAGVPDAERGETVWAWVKPAAGRTISPDGLREFLIDKLSPIEVPRRIVVRAEPLPKTAVGKLSKRDLLIQEGFAKKE
ncbi:MAG: long-chain fatty acid--CoA ligase [Micavibrio sp.]|nr:long-chain fatty acid--CoA ligase [Micavibrio sp.]